MKKYYISLLLINLFSFTVLAQDVDLEWAKSFGTLYHETTSSITSDITGNIFTTGAFVDTVDFDPGDETFNLISNGNYDAYIQKLDSDGNFIWAKSIGNLYSEDALSIISDASGNLYVTGSYSGTVDFNPGPATYILSSESLNYLDVFILKLSNDGDFIWAKSFGGVSSEQGVSIAWANSENIYIMGWFYDIVDFDPGDSSYLLESNGYEDIFIQKLDSSGEFIWAKSMGSIYGDLANSITLDNAENIYIAGRFSDTVDFDPGTEIYDLVSNGSTDAFIQKLDSSGNFIWVKSVGNTSADNIFSIALDDFNNINAIGTYFNTVDFDPGAETYNLTSNGWTDIFIQKLDSNGLFLWAKSIGGTNIDLGKSIFCDGSANLYIAGGYINTVDFDPNENSFELTSNGNYDAFIEKLDSEGNFLWCKSMGSTGSDYVFALTLDDDGNIFTAGNFAFTVDFDPNDSVVELTSNGNVDIFIQKFSQCSVNGTFTISACDNYTWIDGNTYTENNTTATHTIIGAAENGCDSIITLDLTINTVDVSLTISAPTITANTTGAVYQWLDCDLDYMAIEGAIFQSFTPTENGTFAVEITENTCTDTSECVLVTTIGVEEVSAFDQVSIYPNPSKGIVKVDLGKLMNVTIRVFNTNGQSVYFKEDIAISTHQFELNEAPGVYYIELTSKGEKQRYKLVLK